MTKKLLQKVDVIDHISTTEKRILSKADDVIQNMSHTPSKDLRDDVVSHIAARDGMTI